LEADIGYLNVIFSIDLRRVKENLFSKLSRSMNNGYGPDKQGSISDRSKNFLFLPASGFSLSPTQCILDTCVSRESVCHRAYPTATYAGYVIRMAEMRNARGILVGNP
jgi:hypothetical protein